MTGLRETVFALAIAAGAAASCGVRASHPRVVPLPTPPCVATLPDGSRPTPEHLGPGGYGNDALWTNLWMWGEGVVPAPPEHVHPDGTIGPMKWAWCRYEPGRLVIEGVRVGGGSPPLRVTISDAYGDIGLQPVGLIFPAAGCWQITGRMGEATLTFVTSVAPEGAFGRDPS